MLKDLLEKIRKGEKLALSRVLSQVEADTDSGRQALENLFPQTGQAHKIGITGPPGAGKSTLVNALARCLRLLPNTPKVAIIAVDPTSPFTGGAILGDRVRMHDLHGDPGIFIRSLATRGALGGLSNATESLSQVFDAAGYEYILIETVGAGQSEVEIANLAHTTIVVETPGLGDDIQTIKAGILEIADILVVNKADKQGVEQTVRNLRTMLEMGYGNYQESAYKHRLQSKPDIICDEIQASKPQVWIPPVIKTVAPEYEGIDALITAIINHKSFLVSSDLWNAKDHASLVDQINKMLSVELLESWKKQIPANVIDETINGVMLRKYPPRKAVEVLLTYNRIESNLLSSE